jgi:hypothetical protein
MDADGFVDAAAELVADLQIFGRVPAADGPCLQVGTEPLDELLVEAMRGGSGSRRTASRSASPWWRLQPFASNVESRSS